jgi:prepilin-type N-terminal cleavage/methylation domain-containing protein
MKKKSFTLIELLFALVVFSIIFWVLFSLFLRIINTKSNIEARQILVQSTYDIVEQFSTKIQNYTIDYEEYFNRTMVWCSSSLQWNSFVWDSWAQLWYCAKRTQYGNGTPSINWWTYVTSENQHKLYYCSSNAPGILQEWWLLVVNWWWNCQQTLFTNYMWSTNYSSNGWRFIQPYGQYKKTFIDIKADVDDQPVRAWDDDDTDLGVWATAIGDNTHIKELYVVSPDKRKRIFFRRALIATGDWNGNGSIDTDNEKLYAIQMLQLKAFDAWQNHDFDALTYRWVFDWNTDTWACDYDAWFVCSWTPLWWVYGWYNLPANNNDWWINLTNSNISIADWNIQIYPLKDPEYAWWELKYQSNPYIKLYLKTTMYWKNWIGKVWKDNIENITFDVQTTMNIKTNY